MTGIRSEVLPFLAWAVVGSAALVGLFRVSGLPWRFATPIPIAMGLILCGYFVYFFRDPVRRPPSAAEAILAGADGTVDSITVLSSADFRGIAKRSGVDPDALGKLAQGDAVRVSTYLSLFSVHVNRAPIGGLSTFLGYFPGKHYFTHQEKSSEHNQHNAILIENDTTCCLVNQIVGPVCRRVVYWPDHDKPTALAAGDRFGMMKFGSRLDMYFPAGDVEITITTGSAVTAGETIIGHVKESS